MRSGGAEDHVLPAIPAGNPEAWKPLAIVHPVHVDERGSFLSFELWPRTLKRREGSSRPRASPTFYELQFQGRPLRFNLSANTQLLAPGFLVETRRQGGLGQVVLHTGARSPACHLVGQVQSHVQDPAQQGPASQPGSAAISTCDGLVSAAAEGPQLLRGRSWGVSWGGEGRPG